MNVNLMLDYRHSLRDFAPSALLLAPFRRRSGDSKRIFGRLQRLLAREPLQRLPSLGRLLLGPHRIQNHGKELPSRGVQFEADGKGKERRLAGSRA